MIQLPVKGEKEKICAANIVEYIQEKGRFGRKIYEWVLDKKAFIWFNLSIPREHVKYIDGIMPLPKGFREPACGASRYGGRKAVCFPSRSCESASE